MVSHYSVALVLFSWFIAALAAYTALNLASRILALSKPSHRQAWLLGGGLALGTGVWAMHFTGMLAMPLPFEVTYDVGLAAASLLVGIVSSYVALYAMTRPTLGRAGMAISTLWLAGSAAAMHNVGISAMKLSPGFVYDPRSMAGAAAVSLVSSFCAIWGGRALVRLQGKWHLGWQCIASVGMGVALCGIHYAGMIDVKILPGTVSTVSFGIDEALMTLVVMGSALFTVTVALMLSLYDTRTSMLASSVVNLSDEVVRLASLDPLTGLANRTTLDRCVQEAIRTTSAHHRSSGVGFAVLYLDLDRFKVINDSLGHNVGDELLLEFARRLQSCVTSQDMVARIGGDEFVVLQRSVRSKSDVEAMTRKILDSMKTCSWVSGHLLQTTPSIGMALFPQHGQTFDDLLKNADAAMYEAKRASTGFRFFEPAIGENASRMISIQSALNEALENQWFYLNYQPKFDCQTSALTGAEALLRLKHPQLGMLSPQEFIPMAERSGQIVEIGDWVVRQVCKQLAEWDASGLAPVKVAVNISPRQIAVEDFVDRLVDITAKGEGLEKRIMFEITENYAMQDPEKTAVVIQKLQTKGFDVAIDDFGSGCSGLAYLKQFGVEQIKIDREFITDIDKVGIGGKAIIDAVIKLGHALGMHVVAEGVETDNQLATLREMACDQVQGFLMGRPLEVADFSAVMAQAANGNVLSLPIYQGRAGASVG